MNVTMQGLSEAEALTRLAVHGPNAMPEARPTALAVRVIAQFKSPLIYILLLALCLDVGLWIHEGAGQTPFEAIAIGLILSLNAGLGVYQEQKAEASLASLKALAKPLAWVERDGRLMQIPARAIVPGDLARMEAGDRVPADGRLVSGQGVLVDESILTGESLPVEKDVASELFSGTLVIRSKGYVEVTHTGADSTMGRLAGMIGGIEAGTTPLERRLGAFGTQVAFGILAVGLVLILGGLVVEGVGHIGPVVLFAVALAVAAVPEGLPAILTLTLALGVERLAKCKAIVRRLSAVEALGSVTVIATDKTGTLTENRMHVRGIDAPDSERALLAMVIANDAELQTGTGDPLEVALLNYAVSCRLDAKRVTSSRPRLSSQPFDSVTKLMRVTVSEGDRKVSYLKGAPEVLIGLSSLSAEDRQAWENKVSQHASQGSRVLALAWQPHGTEQGLTFLGLVMLWDPPRVEVPEALRRARAAGIRLMMITGDHPGTAKAVCDAIGMPADSVATASDIEQASPLQLRELVRTVDVFARATPEHKLRLVEALKENGEIVAVTGDGVNDAPALKRADIGIAMGKRGSDVAREVSDVVLLDDNFATIVAAIEEGRSIYENIQKFIRFFFSTDLALLVLMLAGLALAFVFKIKDPSGATFLLPLTAAQLLWINVIADGPPALALALDRNPGVMDHPPRPPGAQLLDAASLRFIVLSAATKAAVGIGFLGILPSLDYSIEETRTVVFLYESIMQLAFVYPSRRLSVVPLQNNWVHVTVGLGVLVQLLTILLPPLRAMLGLVPLGTPLVIAVGTAVTLTWAVAQMFGRARKVRYQAWFRREGEGQ